MLFENRLYKCRTKNRNEAVVYDVIHFNEMCTQMESLSRETARFTALEQTLKMNTSMFSLRNGHCSIMKWCVWLSFVSLINQEKSDIGSLLSVALGLIN